VRASDWIDVAEPVLVGMVHSRPRASGAISVRTRAVMPFLYEIAKVYAIARVATYKCLTGAQRCRLRQAKARLVLRTLQQVL
jgi:hypothetical protein